MKNNYVLCLFLLLFGFSAMGQETIAFEGFENDNGPFQLEGNYTGNASGGSPSDVAHAFEGSRAFGVFNGEQTITSQAISTVGYDDITLSLKNLGWGTANSNGFRNNDFLRIEISEDNGDTWHAVVRTQGEGFGGYQWNYSATGVAEGVYAGAATTLASFQRSNSTSPITDAFSTVIITGIPAVAELRIRIAIKTNSGNTFLLCVDNIELVGTPPPCNAEITATTPAARCGSGTVSLAATATNGIPRWFDAATGGTQLGTGSPFTTPTISETTTFWVEAYDSDDECASDREAVIATINAAPVVTTQPVAQVACPDNGTATFLVTASGIGLTYQWQVDEGSGFTDISNGGFYSGATSEELTITNASSSFNAYQYRCVVSGSCAPSATSDAVTFTVNTSFCPAVGDFRSKQSGAWNNAAQWEKWNGSAWVTDGFPGSANTVTVTILDGHAITMTNLGYSGTGNDIVIEEGGSFETIGNTGSFNFNSLNVYGIFIRSNTSNMFPSSGTIHATGIYRHNINGSSIPTMTWNEGATLEITGFSGTTGTMPTATGTYQNVVFNWLANSSATMETNFQNILGDLIIKNTGTSGNRLNFSNSNGATTFNIGGDIIVEGGILYGTVNQDNNVTINIEGGINVDGGIFQAYNGSSNTSNGWVRINFSNNSGKNNSSVMKMTTSFAHRIRAKWEITIQSGRFISLESDLLIGPRSTLASRHQTLTVENGAVFNTGSFIVRNVESHNNSEPWFVLEDGATLITANTEGIRSSGSVGAIQVGGTRTYSTEANYTYNGTAAQVTGNGLPASVNDITIDNSAGVTLTNAVTVNGTLLLANGLFNTGACNASTTSATLLTLADNTTTIGASSDSYVNGVMHKLGDDPFVFPIGNATSYHPVEISSPTLATDRFGACFLEIDPAIAGFDRNSKEVSIAHVADCHFWHLNRISGSSNVTVGLNVDCPSLLATDEIVVRWDGSEWKNEGGTFAAGLVTSDLVNSFSPFTVGNDINAVLPVTLSFFSISCEDEVHQINWQTASELNNNFFSIYRSDDGVNWNLVDRVDGQGSTSQVTNYEWLDRGERSASIVYYKLEQTDFDGTTVELGIVSSDCKKKGIHVFPNPAKDYISVTGIEAGEVLVVFDAIGRVVIELSNVSSFEKIDIANLNKGKYFIKVFGANDVTIQTFIKID